MVTAEIVQQSVEKHLVGTPHFLVAVEVRPGGKVNVEVDNDRGITMEALVLLNKAVRADLGEEADALEFQFSSPGMGRPFKVMRQYRKHIGRIVQVETTDGIQLEGQLDSADEKNIALRIQQPSKVKGRLPKLDTELTTVPFDQVKTTKATITFH